LSFPYVCPEPVLAKWSFLYKNGSKMPFFAGDAFVRDNRAWVRSWDAVLFPNA
jgi:hypothetical protein